ncbi:MAG: hypothetical protein ICV60_08305 [Pyrinomonadaceae bacterium]|nr:hypothetical protein [Pyrinomonadaceae bacterium]
MEEAQNSVVESDTRHMDYTISLTEAAESGDISPNEYARRRASIVGENSILEYIVIPLFLALWQKLFPSDTPNRVLAKSKSD